MAVTRVRDDILYLMEFFPEVLLVSIMKRDFVLCHLKIQHLLD